MINELKSSEDWKYLPQPPYRSSLLQQPYPKGYEAPSFVLFDERKGSPKEHVNCFIDALGPHAGDYNLRLIEFLKSLTDCAYTWYTTLALGFIRSWENLASREDEHVCQANGTGDLEEREEGDAPSVSYR
ncbi:unnamed protein product [Prunus brigantina]